MQIINSGGARIAGNTLLTPAFRGLYLGYDSFGGTVEGNAIVDPGETSILLAWGASDFTISANTLTGALGGEATNIVVDYDARDILISGNQLSGAISDGIMIGYSAANVTVLFRGPSWPWK